MLYVHQTNIIAAYEHERKAKKQKVQSKQKRSDTQADMTFKKTRQNALKKRKYAVLTVYHRKNAVFTNF